MLPAYFFSMACNFCAGQDFHDSVAINHSDSTYAAIDKTKHKQNAFKLAGSIWKNVILSTPGDFGEMGKTVTSNWKQTSIYTAGIALFVLADKPITQFYQDHIERNIDYHLPVLPGATNTLWFRGNDAYLNFSVIGLYGGSLMAKFGTGQKAALNSIKALTYSYLIGHVGLKALFARQRPDPTLSDGIAPKPPFTGNPHEFFHFRKLNFKTGPDGTSFPSMHATAYFAVAKVMAMEFKNYWIPYGAISFIFLADLKSHQHWVGDMVAGGILGTVIGKSIVNSSRRTEKNMLRNNFGLLKNKKQNFSYHLLPSASNNTYALNLFATF